MHGIMAIPKMSELDRLKELGSRQARIRDEIVTARTQLC